VSYIISNPSDLARTKNKWGMGFYSTDVFPYGQGNGGPFAAFAPNAGLLTGGPFPVPPVITCPPPATSTKTGTKSLGFFRPNQALARKLYFLGQDETTTANAQPPAPTPTIPIIPAGGLNVDPTMLIGGIALLAAAMFLFGTKKGPAIRRRRVARLRRRIAAIESGA